MSPTSLPNNDRPIGEPVENEAQAALEFVDVLALVVARRHDRDQLAFHAGAVGVRYRGGTALDRPGPQSAVRTAETSRNGAGNVPFL